jgi:tripartite-type tricarboxylate transporter receptor subunit TctC
MTTQASTMNSPPEHHHLRKPTYRLVLVLASLAAIVIAVGPAHGQYPSRPIRFIVPFPPGGTADVVGRIVGNQLSQVLGQTIIIDNRPGADGVIAAEITMKAPPDGHTIFMGTNSPMSAVPSFRKKPPYDPIAHFTPIASLGRPVFFLFVNPSVPARSVDELVQYARANPGKLAYGTGNTTAIVATAQLRMIAGLDITHVPYKGDAPTTADLMAGRLQLAFMATVPGYQQAREGKLRILATLLTQRSALAPEAPTMAEVGFPGVSVFPWVAVFGPANMPAPVVQRLSREFNAITGRPDISEQLNKLGFVPVGSSPAELGELVRTQLEAWRRAVREAGIPQD